MQHQHRFSTRTHQRIRADKDSAQGPFSLSLSLSLSASLSQPSLSLSLMPEPAFVPRGASPPAAVARLLRPAASNPAALSREDILGKRRASLLLLLSLPLSASLSLSPPLSVHLHASARSCVNPALLQARASMLARSYSPAHALYLCHARPRSLLTALLTRSCSLSPRPAHARSFDHVRPRVG